MLAWAVAAVFAVGADESLVSGPVELLTDQRTFSEGPVWTSGGRWLYTDVPEDTIFTGDGEVFRRPSHNANGLTIDTKGRLIACEQGLHRVTRTEDDGSITVLADQYAGKPLHAPNDVVVRSDGAIFFTDPKPLRDADPDAVPASGVYVLMPGAEALRLLADDFKYPNGIALSPDEKTLYVSDTSNGHIRAFDVNEDGSIANGRAHCDVRIPDGMAVDRAGRIWSASSRGIAVFSPQGTLLGRVEFKGMPTNCAFGGADGRTLLITARQRVYTVSCAEPGLVAARFEREK